MAGGGGGAAGGDGVGIAGAVAAWEHVEIGEICVSSGVGSHAAGSAAVGTVGAGFLGSEVGRHWCVSR